MANKRHLKAVPRPIGRPPDFDYTPELGEYICAQIIEGKSLRKICEREDSEQLKPPTCKICKGQRRRENAAGKFNRQLGKYPGKISGASQSAIFGIMENARGLEAVSRANSWLFAGPGIGTNYLSIGRHCVGRVTPWCRTISRVNYISAAPKNCFVAA
jgi:hypothetical protein